MLDHFATMNSLTRSKDPMADQGQAHFLQVPVDAQSRFDHVDMGDITHVNCHEAGRGFKLARTFLGVIHPIDA